MHYDAFRKTSEPHAELAEFRQGTLIRRLGVNSDHGIG